MGPGQERSELPSEVEKQIIKLDKEGKSTGSEENVSFLIFNC